MSQSHTSKEAMQAFDDARQQNPVPAAEHGTHNKSHAAHLAVEGTVHTSVADAGKQGREPGTLKEPPQDPRTSGKAQHH